MLAWREIPCLIQRNSIQKTRCAIMLVCDRVTGGNYDFEPDLFSCGR